MWNVPPNACSGVTLSSRSRGSRRSIRLTLTWRPGPAVAPIAEQPGQHHRCHAGQHEPARTRCSCRRSAITHLAVRIDRVNLCARDDFGAVAGRRGSQRSAHRTHAADRHVPIAGAAADQVIQETDVLLQRRVVGAGEGADQRVGRHHAAHQIVARPLR